MGRHLTSVPGDRTMIDTAPFPSAAADLRAHMAGHPSADGAMPPGAVPIIRGPLTTRSIRTLAPEVHVSIPADTIGFHVATNAAGDRTDYLTAGELDADQRVLLRLPHVAREYSRLLDLLGRALQDQLTGEFRLTLGPDDDTPTGWQITGAVYVDAEGVSW